MRACAARAPHFLTESNEPNRMNLASYTLARISQMNVALPPEFVQFVDGLVATGSYSTPDAVVRAALEQMRDRQAEFEAFKASVIEADEEIARGEGVTFDVE